MQLRDPRANYHPQLLASLSERAPGFDWSALMAGLQLPARAPALRDDLARAWGGPVQVESSTNLKGLTDADLDAVVASIKGYVQRHGFEDGGKRLPWLDARLADFRQERAKPDDGYRPASEWLAEREKRDSEVPVLSPERVRELLRPARQA